MHFFVGQMSVAYMYIKKDCFEPLHNLRDVSTIAVGLLCSSTKQS